MTESISPFVRFGVLGVGEHGRSLLNSFSRTRLSRLTAIASSSQEKLFSLREKFPTVDCCEGYDALLTHPEVDAVLLALPNHLHYPWAKKLLLAGKHVLCEKPLSQTAAQADELQEIAAAGGKCLVEAFSYRLHTQHLFAQKLIKGREIGEISRIRVIYRYSLPTDSGNYRLRAEFGGGALFDVGCYGIDCARWYFEEEPIRASGRMSKDPQATTERAVDLACDFTLEFSNQRRAEVSVAMNGPRENSLSIEGTGGRIFLSQAFHVKADQKVSVQRESRGERSVDRQEPCDQFARLFDEFAHRVNEIEGSSPLTERQTILEDGRANMRIIEMIRNSVSAGA